jgi:hypothetical protein
MKSVRTLLFVLIIGYAATLSLPAQTLLAGVRAGVNIASATSDDGSVSSKAGLLLGALAQINLWGPLNFRAEAQYVQKGGKFVGETSTSGPSIPTTLDLNYLDIPLNLTLKIGPDAFFVYGTAGTTLGALLSATAINSLDGQKRELASQFNPVDISLDLGGGVGFEVAPHLVVIGDVLYSLGLTDAAKNGTSQTSVFNSDSWKARNVKITTGLYFTL